MRFVVSVIVIMSYTYRNGETHAGYVTAMYPEIHALNFQAPKNTAKRPMP